MFKSVIRFYEGKQYKKGLKAADTLLKKKPDHGETQAMKGLILNSMGNKEEALELVKLGVRNDMRSHVTWHVYGLYNRSNHNYKEAAKCYLNALRIDKENIQILRDLSHLQIQIRDLAGFVETRRQLVVLKPGVKANWICYAVAQYKAGDYSEAFNIAQNYIQSSDSSGEDAAVIPYEHGELLLFQNMCLEKQEKYEEALKHLNKNEKMIPDKLSLRTKRAEMTCLLGDHESARRMWQKLVQEQPMNYRYHSGYQTSLLELDRDTAKKMFALERHHLPCTVLSLTPSQVEKLIFMYNEKVPPSSSTSKILLSLYKGEQFTEKLKDFLREGIKRGFPALYNDVCSLMMTKDVFGSDPSAKIYATDSFDLRTHPVMTQVLEILDGFISNLSSSNTFDGVISEEDVPESPTCLMWALFLRCHLYGMLGRLPEALKDIEDAIDHTPTSLDCLYKRARILKLCGDIQGAATAMDYCRSLDLQDRYVNNKATKYFLRADKIPQAKETIAMFTKYDGDPELSIHYIQCIWYAQETAEAYARTEQWAMALKKYYAIEEYFDTFLEDQFDFHSFAMRKSTIRSYLETLENMDHLLAHHTFQAAGRGAIRVQLQRVDCPSKPVESLSADFSQMTAAEKKKEKARLRKLKNKQEKQEKQEKEEEERHEEDGDLKKSGQPKSNRHLPADEDPLGEKIMAKDPLVEAGRWADRLLQHAPREADSFEAVSEVKMRSGRPVEALRSIQRGLRLQPLHPGLTLQLLRWAVKWLDGSLDIESSLEGEVKAVLCEQKCDSRETLKSVAVGFAEKAARGELTLLHRVFAAKCLLLLDSDAVKQASELLSDEKLWTQRGVSFKKAVEAYQIISRDLELLSGAAERFREQIVSRYPLSNFAGSEPSKNYTGVVELEVTE